MVEDTHCNYISESIEILLKDARFVWQLRSCSTSRGQDHCNSEMYLFFCFCFWSGQKNIQVTETILYVQFFVVHEVELNEGNTLEIEAVLDEV